MRSKNGNIYLIHSWTYLFSPFENTFNTPGISFNLPGASAANPSRNIYGFIFFLTLPIFASLEREGEGSRKCCNLPFTFFIFIYKVNSYLGGTLYLLIMLAIFTLFFIERASETSATDPPQVSARQIRNKDLPAKSKPFGDCQIEVDILSLTVMKEDTCEDCEFLSCLAYLNPDFCKIYQPDLGYVYLGNMGEDDLKLNVAVMKCYEGSSSTGGSIVVVINSVKVLKPKAVFCVGSCSGLNVTKVSLGDVVVLKKLVTYAFSKVTENGIEELGVKVPLKPHLSKLILSAGEGWKPPLKDPGTLEIRIHRGTFLSGPEVINNHKGCNALIERFPEAVAIEREGEGKFLGQLLC